MPSAQVDIVIVNWNTGELLRKCLESLNADPFVLHNANVIVIDNDSADDSWESADNISNVVLKRMNANLGFARACNEGARLGTAPCVLFLNPDTKVTPGVIERSLNALESKPDVGALGVRLMGEDKDVQRSCARFPSLRSLTGSMIGMDYWWPGFHGLTMRDWAHDQSRSVDHIIGAYYLLSRSLFEQLDGFDERYFVYLEDLDLSKRIHQQGLNVYYEADIEAYHLGGGSSSQVRAHRLYYSIESRFLYTLKHLGSVKGALVILFTFFIEMPVRIAKALATGRFQDIGHIFKASAWLLRSLPSVVSGTHSARVKGLDL